MGHIPPFVTIAAGQLENGKAVLYALDFDGVVWEKAEGCSWERVRTFTPHNPPASTEA